MLRILSVFCLFISISAFSQDRVSFVKKVDKVDVLVGGKYFTSYFFPGESQLKKGDNIILAAFGGGFTWGSIWLKWAYDTK